MYLEVYIFMKIKKVLSLSLSVLNILILILYIMLYTLKLYLYLKFKMALYRRLWLWKLRRKLRKGGLPESLINHICKEYNDYLSNITKYVSLRHLVKVLKEYSY